MMKDGQFPVVLAYDTVLKRPACVLVAAGMLADTWPCHKFKTEDWLLAPTPNMGRYPVENMEMLQKIINITENR